ncbi:beta-ketoacyl synthase N-terminal-like domain-containing protein [Streptomyces sp. NPDC054841]
MTEVTAGAIAITGMSGRFPGAPDLRTYWRNLRDGVCSLTDFTPGELDAAGVDPDEARLPGYVPAQGHLADADRFEAELFGFNRTEAAALDPQHRLLLETAWAALEDAGHGPRDAAPVRTGVYVGGSPTEHMLAAQTDRGLATSIGAMQVRILTDREFLAPWVSYRLGLDGPSMTVQTACSTSLTAVHLAAQALLLGECDTALAGGVAVGSVHKHGYVHQEGGIFSPDGRCRPFDERAAGTVPGHGVGVVVLRRLEDALADGDPVRAVLRGTAVTNDGAAKVGFTAPGVDQQTAAIAEAWSAAGLEPALAQYLEAHGTGTQLGDRIEIAAASAALAGSAGCRIGSVKSNIGHLDAAAGVAALIKTVLMLEHATLAPTVNVTRPHPDLPASPFRLVERAESWPRPAGGGPRLAGVSSVGIGGTNVHVVLAEAPRRPARPEPAGHTVEVLPLSARTEDRLAALAGELAQALGAPDAPALADAAHTLRTGRTPLAARAYVTAAGLPEAVAELERLARGAAPVGAPHPLGEAWLKGEDVDWPEPDAGTGVRRVSLPAYPFAGDSFGSMRLGPPVPVPVSAPEAPGMSGVADAPAVPGGPEAAVPADGGLRAAVSAVLRETLGLDGRPGDLDATYFAVGGDSLTAVHLVGRLGDEFGLDVPIELFLEQLTLSEMVDRIVADRATAGSEDPGSLEALLDEFEAEAGA